MKTIIHIVTGGGLFVLGFFALNIAAHNNSEIFGDIAIGMITGSMVIIFTAIAEFMFRFGAGKLEDESDKRQKRMEKILEKLAEERGISIT